jgi:hypothetical protein
MFSIILGGLIDRLVVYIDILFANCKELRRLTLGIAIFYYRTPLYIKIAK